jgi:predicted dehydrogenase
MNTHKNRLRVGVVGVGTMGRHHVRIVAETSGVTLTGFHDPDPTRSDEICRLYGCPCFDSLDDLLRSVDAVTVAAPTSMHVEIGQQCLAHGVNLLMEKPLAHDLEGAVDLVELAARSGVVLMVGHVERYNPAVGKLMELLDSEPEDIVSIDARRLAPFDGSRCMDVNVLHDLLIHDVDLALDIAGSPINSVSAAGRPVFSHQLDMVQARIEFENRAVAGFLVGKCSPKKVRSITVTTPTRYLLADTLTNTLTVARAEMAPSEAEGICFMTNMSEESVLVPHEEPLRREFDDFFRAIMEGTNPLVDGRRALAGMRAVDLISRSIASGGLLISETT